MWHDVHIRSKTNILHKCQPYCQHCYSFYWKGIQNKREIFFFVCLHYFYLGLLINMTLNVAGIWWKAALLFLGSKCETWLLSLMFKIIVFFFSPMKLYCICISNVWLWCRRGTHLLTSHRNNEIPTPTNKLATESLST